jgi:hypothetical protein
MDYYLIPTIYGEPIPLLLELDCQPLTRILDHIRCFNLVFIFVPP